MTGEKSYISIQSDQGIVYEGEGSLFKDDWKLKVDGGILANPWYHLLEIRQESDGKLRISQGDVYKKDFYRLASSLSNPISGGFCNLSFLEKILQGFRGEKHDSK